MSIRIRDLGSLITAAILLSAAPAKAAPQVDPLLFGFVAGMAVGSLPATVMTPPQSAYVYYPAVPYWSPEPPAPAAYHPGDWHAPPDFYDDEDGDGCEE